MKTFSYALVAFLAQLPVYFPTSPVAVKVGALAVGITGILHALHAEPPTKVLTSKVKRGTLKK